MKLIQVGSNQTELQFIKDGMIYKVLFSYETPVAFKAIGINGLSQSWRTDKKFSVTTSRHINKWIDAKHGIAKQSEIDNLINNVDVKEFVGFLGA